MSAKAAIESRDLVILVAEDDPNDVLLLKRAFSKARIQASLFFVSNGQEAIRYVQGQAPFENRENYPRPHILLLDLNMPEVNGLEVLEWLASRPDRASLVVIVFSSCMAPADSRQAAMLGAHACVTKPFDPAVLVPVLANLDHENCAPQVRSNS